MKMEKKLLKNHSPLTKLRSYTLLLFLLCTLLIGCSKKITDLSIINFGNEFLHKDFQQQDSLTIRFMGVACFLFEFNGRAVLTDPFISNPPMRNVLFGKIKTDTTLVNKYAPKENLAKVSLVAVGHAHYDHLLDLPYMAASIPASAKFCGSQTMKHTLVPAKLPQQIITMNEIAADSSATGQWIYNSDSTMRLMAALSTHPPHFLNVILYEGPYRKDIDQIPVKTRQWKCGQTLSFLIDFLDNQKQEIVCRIYIQSSGAPPKQGFFPPEVLNERHPDVAVFGIANDHKQKEYPYKAIDEMQPEFVFVAHWENFMREKERPYKTVQTGNPKKFYYSIKSTYPNKEIILPAPGSFFTISGVND